MSKRQRFDVMVLGAGVSAAWAALAVARHKAARGRSRRSVCLLRAGEPGGDVVAAGYGFLNPKAVDVVGGLKSKLARLTDGSFKGMEVIGAADGRRGEFASRSISGYVADGPKMLKALLTLCRSAGVKVIDAPADADVGVDGESVLAAWDGKTRAEAELSLVADLAALDAAEGLGFRHHWLSRTYRCYGVTFDSTAARVRKAFGASPRLTTVWQLGCLDGGGSPTSPSGQDGHAWVIPRKSSVAVGLLLARPARAGDASAGERLMGEALGELRSLGVLDEPFDAPGPVDTWRLPLAAALEIESHVGKRTLAVGMAGGFVSALSGQWLYPAVASADLAAGVLDKALKDKRPQDALAGFGVRWRQKLADYLRSPNTRLAFLLPLAFGNQQILNRFCRAYLLGENF